MKRELLAMCLLALAGSASAQTVTRAPSTIRPVQAPVVTVPPATTPDPRESRSDGSVARRTDQLQRARHCEENARLNAQRAEAAQHQDRAMDSAVTNLQIGVLSAAGQVAGASQSTAAPASATARPAPITAPRAGVAAPAAASTAQPSAQPSCPTP